MLLKMKFLFSSKNLKIHLFGYSVILWHSWLPLCVEDANCSERNMTRLVGWKVSSPAFCCSGKRQRKGDAELPGFTHSQTFIECLLCAEQTPKANVSLVYFEGKVLPSLSMVTCWPHHSRGTMGRVCCILVVFNENPGTELGFPRGGRVPQGHWLRWSVFLPPFYGGKGHWIGNNWLSCSWPVGLSCKVTSHTTSNRTTANVPSCFICSVLYTYTPHTCTTHRYQTHSTHTSHTYTCHTHRARITTKRTGFSSYSLQKI